MQKDSQLRNNLLPTNPQVTHKLSTTSQLPLCPSADSDYKGGSLKNPISHTPISPSPSPITLLPAHRRRKRSVELLYIEKGAPRAARTAEGLDA